MKLAWAVSIVTQAMFASTRYRAGQRDWWTAYLAADLAVSLLRWPFLGTDAGWSVWKYSEWFILAVKLRCCLEIAARVRDRSWVVSGLFAAAAGASWSLAMSIGGWPVSRREVMLLSQLGSYLAGGIVLGAAKGGAALQAGVLPFFSLGIIRSIAGHFIGSRPSVDLLNTAYLSAVALSFAIATASPFLIRRRAVYHG